MLSDCPHTFLIPHTLVHLHSCWAPLAQAYYTRLCPHTLLFSQCLHTHYSPRTQTHTHAVTLVCLYACICTHCLHTCPFTHPHPSHTHAITRMLVRSDWHTPVLTQAYSCIHASTHTLRACSLVHAHRCPGMLIYAYTVTCLARIPSSMNTCFTPTWQRVAHHVRPLPACSVPPLCLSFCLW